MILIEFISAFQNSYVFFNQLVFTQNLAFNYLINVYNNANATINNSIFHSNNASGNISIYITVKNII